MFIMVSECERWGLRQLWHDLFQLVQIEIHVAPRSYRSE